MVSASIFFDVDEYLISIIQLLISVYDLLISTTQLSISIQLMRIKCEKVSNNYSLTI